VIVAAGLYIFVRESRLAKDRPAGMPPA
jgi:hypothetical protein